MTQIPVTVDILQGSLLELWDSIVAYLPSVLGALVVFVIGIIIAHVLRRVVVQIVNVLHIDELAARFELKASLEKMGIKLNVAEFLGWIVKWFFVIVSLIAATDILGWDQVTDYLKQVV